MATNKQFTIDNRNSQIYFDIYVYDKKTDNVTHRVYDVAQIPGRSGDILIGGDRFPNVPLVYDCIMCPTSATLQSRMNLFRNFMSSKKGYFEISDTIHPTEFYQAYLAQDIDMQVSRDRTMAKFELSLMRKPQRWLVTGKDVITLTSSGTVTNSTMFPAYPLLRVYGTGTVRLGGNGRSITINENPGSYIDIDCEYMEAYEGSVNRNSKVTFVNNLQPYIAANTVLTIYLLDGITKVEVTPRWYNI